MLISLKQVSTLSLVAAFLFQGGCTMMQYENTNSRATTQNGSPLITGKKPTRKIAPNVLRRNQMRAANGPKIRRHQEPAPFTGMVSAHNKVRAGLGIAPIRWSPRLASYAQAWANILQTRQACRPNNRQQGLIYGENIVAGAKHLLTPAAVVNLWESEQADYDLATGRCGVGKNCKHYSQIIWRDTSAVGCGEGICGNQAVWVCNYNPPGNIRGELP